LFAHAEVALLQLCEFVVGVVEKLNDEDRLARLLVELQQVARGLKRAVPLGLVEENCVDVFERRGLEIDQLDRCLHRVGDRLEKDETNRRFVRYRHELQFRGYNRAECAFAARPKFRGVAPVAKIVVERVARPPFDERVRHARGDEFRRLVEFGAEVRRHHVRRGMLGVKRHDLAVGEHRFERKHMIRRRAVHRRVRARRIVGNHAAKRRPRTGRDVRPETQTVLGDVPVQFG